MNMVSIEIIDEIAIKELEEMESRKLIKFNNPNKNSKQPSNRFWGKISDETAQELQNHIETSRLEWVRT